VSSQAIYSTFIILFETNETGSRLALNLTSGSHHRKKTYHHRYARTAGCDRAALQSKHLFLGKLVGSRMIPWSHWSFDVLLMSFLTRVMQTMNEH